MTDYEQLVNDLRNADNLTADHRILALTDRAAGALEELQAEVDQWKAAVKGQEDGIKVLQAEVERLQVDVEAAYALMEVQDADN